MLDVFARTMKALLLGKPAEELAFQGTAPDALLMPLTEASLHGLYPSGGGGDLLP